MSTEAISKETFLREYVQELHNKNAALFAGAGLSVASGHVDWKTLLRDIITDLRLNPEEEDDLVTLAQYHCNQAQGNRSALTKTIFDYFSQEKIPNENHRILSALPIDTYWTTNYDNLIEKALDQAKKVVDVKYTIKHLAQTKRGRDAVIYKMHGDSGHPTEAIISKDDYERYPYKMEPFVSALRGDLIEKTFLFIGFSFTDPNLDYILGRVKALYESNARRHYCIQKKASQGIDEEDGKFKIRQIKQDYFIKDLKRFAIQTVLVDEYAEITELLKEVASRYRKKSIFISGAAHEFGGWGKKNSEDFLHKTSYQLLKASNRLITGFGLGVGGPVLNGALEYISDQGRTISEDDIVLRPFPQTPAPGSALADQWKAYREEIIQHAGIAIFLFGNKEVDGETILSNGMEQEFEIAKKQGLVLLPIGATGYMAKELWDRVLSEFHQYFPNSSSSIKSHFESLGDTTKTSDEIAASVLAIIRDLQREQRHG